MLLQARQAEALDLRDDRHDDDSGELRHDASAPTYSSPDGDPDSAPPSIEELYKRYAPYVGAIALRLLGRRDEVDDLVQDVFLSALRGLHALREPAAIKGWLATVAVRQVGRRLRARRLRSFLRLELESDYAQIADGGASPEERALLAAVYGVLDTLPVSQRLAWTLRYIEGEELTKVAELCGCSLATAKRRISAAHDTIRRTVDP